MEHQLTRNRVSSLLNCYVQAHCLQAETHFLQYYM